jgi:CHAT domain-containing protein
MSGLRLARNFIGGAALTFVLSACVTVPDAASDDVLTLGKNARGERCTATTNWTDEAHPRFVKTKNIYSVNCSGAATDALARVRLFTTAAARTEASKGLQCGAPSDVALAGFDRASARRCFDPALGFATVVIDADIAGSAVQISAASNAVGAGYQAALLLTGQTGDGAVNSARTPVDVAALAPLPADLGEALASSGPSEDGDTLLTRAIELNFRGLSADASRFLRNEINRLPAGTPAKVRAQLLLEAGLADSNIKFFSNADANLAAAESVIRGLPASDQRLLRPKLDTYRGLHALNQRDFAAARRILAPLANRASTRVQGLNDPATLVQLNTVVNDGTDIRSVIAVPNFDLARETVIGVQGNWALSVAESSTGNRQAALRAIDLAQNELDRLSRSLEGQRINQDGLYWLSARLVRQRGRIQAESRDFGGAVASFDQAIATLVKNNRAGTFAAEDPAVAELRLERAAIIDRAGRPAAEVEAAYIAALDAMLSAREASPGFTTGLLNPLLNSLAARMAKGDKAAAGRYFDALQVAGESSAARQVSQLQQIVGEDPAIADKRRERQDLLVQINALSAQIVDGRNLGEVVGTLEADRARAEAAFREVEANLAANSRLAQVSDRPANLAALQAKLKPGEGYVRLTVMNDRVFGILVDRDNAYPIQPKLVANDIIGLANAVRRSTDVGDDQVLPEFSASGAAALYQALFAGVDGTLRAKTELVFDGGAVLAGLPAGLLVTDRPGPRAAGKSKYDYTEVAFLAKQMPTSVAMSPRSFIASREFAPSRATNALIGFAAPESIGKQPIGTGGKFRIGPCLINAADVTAYSNRFTPIAADEIFLAAEALGLNGRPTLISGASFSDTEMVRRGAAEGGFGDYKVLHFATHGLTEGQFDCSEAPAALLTSFGGTSASDLLLSYDEIAGLRLDANLVVLSACDTASRTGEGTQIRAGEAQPGSTLDGLVRAFFAAGSRSVMATYWEAANNDATILLMSEFYAAGREKTISESLNAAQNTLITIPDTSHPFFWASFFVVGDTDNTILGGAKTTVAAR